jgi:hypothetical protein
VIDVIEENIWQRSNVAQMEHLSEQNSELKKIVEKQRALILKLKTEKMMHKAEIQYRDRKDCQRISSDVFLVHCVCIGSYICQRICLKTCAV